MAVPDVAVPPLPPEPSLEWLDRIAAGAPVGPLSLPLVAAPIRYTRSASELRAGRGNIAYWRMVYEHGVVPPRRFAGHGGGDGGLPADLRGTLIHSVLERVEEADEIAALLDVAVGSLDSPELEEHLAPGSRYREGIKREIRSVVTSDEWRWYVDGEHWRELWFVQFRTPRKWRVGAFDLYRPGDPGVIVDFKTSKVDASGAAREARKYAIQAAMYRTVAGALGAPAEVRFHFTGPNVVVEQ